MNDHLPPYPAYKDSGVPWLSAIPAHWEVKRVKAAVAQINEQTSEKQTGGVYVSLEHVESWTGRVQLPDKDVAFDSQVKRFQPNDVLFGKLRPYLAKVARLPVDGVCVSEFLVLRPRSCSLLAAFLENVLRSKPIIDVVNSSTFGAKMPRTDWGFIGNLLIGFPPPDEQAAIVRYLDYTDRRIRRYIAAKRKLITLLNEQKQAIIHRAVTRGIDPDVRLKPSGVEWLGDVPEHWEVKRLKFVARVQTGITLGKTYGPTQLERRPYLRVANVQDGYLDLKHVITIEAPSSEIASSELRAGDVLMTEGGDIDKLGRGYIWRGEIDGCLHQNHIFAVRANTKKLLPEFLNLLMTSRHGRLYFQLTAKQTTNLASTNSTKLKAFPLPLPPLSEQTRLVHAVRQEVQELTITIGKIEREIDLIREYRTRLIADVVTGKVDVRAAAAALPDEADVPDVDMDVLAEDDDLIAAADEELVNEED